MRSCLVDLELPKFKFSSRFDLMGSLQALGLASLAAHIDAQAIFQTPQAIRLSQLLHGAEIEVDESGTRAAAATIGAFDISMPPTFYVDRPFAFVVRQGASGTPLFVGVVSDPSP